ncbi:hypothetical protein D4764_15G0000130 [Takifugu flavidus]|uniref:Uncharacterized protein n=1 Tax=Takifugu flavidus TaxID=433684 RepID=A0A5C6P136_9TELE|nr:hypothetical protein D4764_15G0000130 [Takifugu flavidus]
MRPFTRLHDKAAEPTHGSVSAASSRCVACVIVVDVKITPRPIWKCCCGSPEQLTEELALKSKCSPDTYLRVWCGGREEVIQDHFCSDETDNSPPLQLHTLKEFEQSFRLYHNGRKWDPSSPTMQRGR